MNINKKLYFIDEKPTRKFNAIKKGPGYTLALTTDGKIFACGINNACQLGLGHTRDVAFPILIEGIYFWGRLEDGTLIWNPSIFLNLKLADDGSIQRI